MPKNHERELIDALHELDNKVFDLEPCTIVFFCGSTPGERYVDVQMVTGHIHINDATRGKDLASILNADDLMDAVKQLAAELRGR